MSLELFTSIWNVSWPYLHNVQFTDSFKPNSQCGKPQKQFVHKARSNPDHVFVNRPSNNVTILIDFDFVANKLEKQDHVIFSYLIESSIGAPLRIFKC